MKLLERILFATDFSDSANDALQMAQLVAKTFNSELIFIHVIPEKHNTSLTVEMLKQVANNKFERLTKDITASGIQIKKCIVETGTPFAHIIHHADLNDVNVIIIGSGEYESDEKFQVGTTAYKLMRKATKPVWLAKSGSKASINKILCPVDLSEHSHRALKNAIHLSRDFKAELIVIHVVHQLSTSYLGIKKKTKPEDYEAYQLKNKIEFDEFFQGLDFYNVTWQKIIKEGEPQKEIVKAALENKCDLVIMGAVGLDAHPRLFMGSIAEKVIRELPCSIVTLKYIDPIRVRIESKMADLATHCQQGKELLAEGFTEEAMQEFNYCIKKDEMYVSAWQGLAEIHKRLGHLDEAKKCQNKIYKINNRLEEQRIEAEVRKQHWLWK